MFNSIQLNPSIIITGDSKKNSIQKPSAADTQKSQRYLDDAEYHQTDLNIPKSMQDFLYSKMSKNIASSIEFVDIVCNNSEQKRSKKNTKDKTEFVVKLLRDTEPITHIDKGVPLDEPILIKQRKPSIVRRQIEPIQMTNEDKLSAVVLDGESIQLGNEVRNWKPKKIRTHKFFNYREKNNKLYFVEPVNEFSAKRKKNNWTESKIAKWKLNN